VLGFLGFRILFDPASSHGRFSGYWFVSCRARRSRGVTVCCQEVRVCVGVFWLAVLCSLVLS
jgi:hypothetical protein